jgi:hypothetical protein
MESKSVFISSCTRRELSRRRSQWGGGVLRMQILMALLVVALGFGAFVAGRGGV